MIRKKLKPVGLLLSGKVFELEPSTYLHSNGPSKCSFSLNQGNLPDNMVLIGSQFFRNFYSIFDFEQEKMSFAVNRHSSGVRIY